MHRAGAEGSSEELDEFGLVLKFIWGNPQLQPETDTYTLGLLCCPPPPILPPWSGRVHTLHPCSHTYCVNRPAEHSVKRGISCPVNGEFPAKPRGWVSSITLVFQEGLHPGLQSSSQMQSYSSLRTSCVPRDEAEKRDKHLWVTQVRAMLVLMELWSSNVCWVMNPFYRNRGSISNLACLLSLWCGGSDPRLQGTHSGGSLLSVCYNLCFPFFFLKKDQNQIIISICIFLLLLKQMLLLKQGLILSLAVLEPRDILGLNVCDTMPDPNLNSYGCIHMTQMCLSLVAPKETYNI